MTYENLIDKSTMYYNYVFISSYVLVEIILINSFKDILSFYFNNKLIIFDQNTWNSLITIF